MIEISNSYEAEFERLLDLHLEQISDIEQQSILRDVAWKVNSQVTKEELDQTLLEGFETVRDAELSIDDHRQIVTAIGELNHLKLKALLSEAQYKKPSPIPAGRA